MARPRRVLPVLRLRIKKPENTKAMVASVITNEILSEGLDAAVIRGIYKILCRRQFIGGMSAMVGDSDDLGHMFMINRI